MNQKLTNQLFNDFPSIFKGRFLPITESLIPFGIEAGDGWYPLIRALCVCIKHTKQDVVAAQVKEKYGSLSFYYCGGDRYIDGLVDMANAMSAFTCEECGNTTTAKIRGGSWLLCRCDTCWEKINK